MNKDKISSRQAILILTMFRLTLVLSHTPALDLPPANQDIWMIVILSFFYTTLLRIPLLFFANKFKDISMMEYIELIMGKFIGKLIIIIYGLYFAAYSIYVITVQTNLAGVAILAKTPYWLLIAFVTIISIYICLKGLVMIFWTGEFILPISLVSIIFLILLGLKFVDFALLLPILSDSSFLDINKGAIMLSLILTDIFILIMSLPYLECKKDINKIFIKSSIYSSLLVIAIIIVTQGALGIEQAKHSNYPFLVYTRLIKYQSVFERIDLFFILAWLGANVGRIIIYTYLSYMVFEYLFKVKESKSLIYTICIFISMVSIYLVNTGFRISSGELLNAFLMYSTTIFIIIIPSIAMIVYFFRRKSIDKAEKLGDN